MPCDTQDIQQYLKRSDNLYEPVMVIARRARQINEELFQKKRDQQILEELEGEMEEDMLHLEEPKPEVEEPVEIEENPIITAKNEFLNEKIDFHYEK
ncbi:MAG TPA: hypothetical protein ENK14_13615 [Caldithrix sp.]|nr:hypothetical protein [Caldithrix sp.]